MKTIECVVCGHRIERYTPHRENTVASDHLREAHPEVKSRILTRHLFREVEESDE